MADTRISEFVLDTVPNATDLVVTVDAPLVSNKKVELQVLLALYDAQISILTNKTFDADGTGNTLSNVDNANIKAAAAIDASKLADGTVSNAEFQFINSLSSNAQDQLDTKLSDVTGSGLLDARIWVGDGANLAVERTMGGDVFISNTGVTTIQANSVNDGKITSHVSTKITINTKGQLNSNIVYTDQANTFGAFQQRFPSTQLQIDNPAQTSQYILTTSAIAADRVVTLPLLTAPDTFVFNAFAAILTNKTIDADNNTVTNIGSSEVVRDIITGQTSEASPVGADEILIDEKTSGALRRVTISSLPTGSSLPVVDTTSIVEGSADATKELRFEVDGNATGVIGVIATTFTTAKTITVPDATDQLIARNTADTILNKVITSTTNRVDVGTFEAPSEAQGDIFFRNATVWTRLPRGTDNQALVATATTVNYESLVIGTQVTGASTALTDTADIAYLNTANTFIAGNKNAFSHSASTAGIAVIPIAGNPSALVNGDIWINDTSNTIFARINGANVDLGGAGASLPVVDTTSIAEGSADASKEVRFEVDGNTTGIVGILATIFTTAKTVTFPDATDTLMGKATVDIMTNKTYNADSAGNVLTNVGSSEVKSELITGQTTVTALTGDFVLISDTSDSANLKKVNASDFLGGASQTPWLQDIDADTFALTWGSVDAAVPAATVEYITNVTAGLVSNVATGLIHDWQVANVSEMTLSASALDVKGNNIILGGNPAVLQFSTTGHTIGEDVSNNMEFDVPSGDSYIWSIAGSAEMALSNTVLDVQANTITDVGGLNMNAGTVLAVSTATIQFFNANETIVDNAQSLQYDVATGEAHIFRVNDVTEFTLDAAALTLGAGNNIVLQASGAAGFVQMGEITDPAAGTASGKFYVKDVTGVSKPFFIGEGQAAVDLTAGTGSQTPWLTDIVADGFDLNDLSNLEFRVTTGAPAGTVANIHVDAENDMVFNVPATDRFEWHHNAVSVMTLTETALTVAATLQMGVDDITFNVVGNKISANAGGMEYEVESGDSHEWFIAGIAQIQLTAGAGLSFLARRLNQNKGTDEVAASELTLTTDGNTFDITGGTTINTISPASWRAGAVIHLQFDGTPIITHNSGGTNDILLGNQANMTAAIGDVLSLFFNGTDWVEISRSTVGGAGGEFTAAWTANHNQGGSTFSLEDARFADPTDDTKTIQLNLAGMTTAIELTLSTSQTTAQTLTLPNIPAAATAYVTPALQDLEMASFDLRNISNLEFQVSTGFPAIGVNYITNNTAGMFLNVPTGDVFRMAVQGVNAFGVSATEIDLFNNNLVGVIDIVGGFDNTMEFDERTGDPAVGVNKCIIYAKDVGGDTHLFQDNSTEAPIDLTTGAGGEFPNWTQDHSTNGNSFLLTNDISPPAGTVMAIYSSATDMKFNVSAADVFDFSVNNVDVLSVSTTGLDLQNGQLLFLTGESIQMEANDMHFDVTATNTFSWDVAGVSEMSLATNGTLTVGGSIELGSSQQIQWSLNPNRRIINSTAGTQYEVEAGDTHLFQVDSAAKLTISSTQADMHGNQVVLGSTANVLRFGGDESIGIEASDMIFDVSVGDVFRFETIGIERINIGDAGINMLGRKITDIGETTITDLTTVTGVAGDFVWIIDATDGLNKKVDVTDFLSAASQTPWTSDINADTFALTWLGEDAVLPSIGVEYVTNISAGLRYNVATGKTHAFGVNGTENMTLSLTSLDLVGDAKNITMIGSGAVGFLQMAEITDPAAGTNSGKFYVKDVAGVSRPFFIGDGLAATDMSTGTEVTAWTADHTTNGNSFLLTDDATPPAATVKNIHAEAGGLNLNVPTGEEITLQVNGVDQLVITTPDVSFTDNNLQLAGNRDIIWAAEPNRRIQNGTAGFNFGIETGDTFSFDVQTVAEFIIAASSIKSGDTTTPLWDIERTTAQTDNYNIGELRWRHPDAGAVQVNYGMIRVNMLSDVAASEDGAMHFFVTQAGTHDLEFMNFNNVSDGQINILKPMDFNAQNILGVLNVTLNTGGTLLLDTDATNAALRDIGHTADPSANDAGDMYYNTTSNEFRFFNGTVWRSMDAAGGAQTPWATDIDAASFDLRDLSNLEFVDPTTGVPAATVNAIYVEAAGMVCNVSSGNNFVISIADADRVTVSTSGMTLANNLNLAGNDITSMGRVQFQDSTALGGTVRYIRYEDTVTGFNMNSLTGDDCLTLRINDVIQYSFSDQALTITGNRINLDNGQLIRWTTSNERALFNDTNGFTFDVETGDTFSFDVQTVPEYIFNATTADFNANTLTDVGGITTTAGATINVIGTGATGFIDIDEITAPAAPAANVVRLHVKDVGGNSHIFQDNSTEAAIDLTTGSEVTTWTANHTAADFDFLAKPTPSTDFFEMLVEVTPTDDAGTEPIYHINIRRDDVTTIQNRPLMEISDNDIPQLEIRVNGDLDLRNNDLQMQTGAIFFGTVDESLSTGATTMQLQTEVANTIVFKVGSPTEMTISSTIIDFQANTITNVQANTITNVVGQLSCDCGDIGHCASGRCGIIC